MPYNVVGKKTIQSKKDNKMWTILSALKPETQKEQGFSVSTFFVPAELEVCKIIDELGVNYELYFDDQKHLVFAQKVED